MSRAAPGPAAAGVRRALNPAGMAPLYPGASHGVQAGPWIFVSGQLAADHREGPEILDEAGAPLWGEDRMVREVELIFDRLERILAEAESSLALGLRIDQFPTVRAVADAYHLVRRVRVPQPRPASTSVGVDRLLWAGCRTEVELVALAGGSGLQKGAVTTDRVPAPISGYVPAVTAGDYVFVSGQMATDWRTGVSAEAGPNPAFWTGSAIDLEARYILKNVALTLEAAGSSLADVVKAQVYLADLSDLPRLERVWKEVFPDEPPARTVQRGSAFGVAAGRIEVNVVAVRSGGSARRLAVPADADGPPLHQSLAVRAGDLIFLSGLMAADRRGLASSARVGAGYLQVGLRKELDHIFGAAEQALNAAGSSLSNSVRAQFSLSDLAAAPVLLEALPGTFGRVQPAVTVVGLDQPVLVPGAKVQMDLWAVADGV